MDIFLNHTMANILEKLKKKRKTFFIPKMMIARLKSHAS